MQGRFTSPPYIGVGKVIILKIFAKIVFFPLYLVLFFASLFMYFFSLAMGGNASFDEILEYFMIDEYWNFD